MDPTKETSTLDSAQETMSTLDSFADLVDIPREKG